MEFILYLLFTILLPLAAVAASFFITYVVFIIKGRRFKKKSRPASVKKKRSGFFRRIYIDFPIRFWLDRFETDPDEFNEYGLHLFCGEQGSGKTTAVVDLLLRLQARYSLVKVRTNFNYVYQDGEITDWRELVKNENGIYGQVEVIDEIQTWFSSMQSKDFPPEMLTEISQQRKQRKMLVGTAQVFGRVAKPIREQTTFVYCPLTLFGCLTIVRVTKPQYYDDENFKFKRYIRHYFFIHSYEVRNAFDTYRKIEGLTKSGFNIRSDIKA